MKILKHKLIVVILLAGLALTLVLSVEFVSTGTHMPPGYWVWGWPDLEQAKQATDTVIYQGDIKRTNSGSVFIKRGITPHPLCCNKSVTLLVRVYQLPRHDYFIRQVDYLIASWREHGIKISGLQIDHDSPSSGLNTYTAFIQKLAPHYPANFVSITGLASWLGDDLPAVRKLSENVDFIAFQLYQNYEPVIDHRKYLHILANKFYSNYKLGITTSPKFNNITIPNTPNFKGLMVFLNRGK